MTIDGLENGVAPSRAVAPEPGTHDVHLVVPPYAPLEHPSLALGVLKAGLTARGIRTTVSYLNLMFAADIGLGRYAFFGSTGALALLGEWTFARCAFPDARFDDDAYFDLTESLLDERYGAKESRASARVLLEDPDLRRAARATRQAAERLIDRQAREIVARRPRIVGCSSTFQQHLASLALLRRIHELAPDIATVLGGANCDGPMGRANHESFSWLDLVVAGEADLLFPELCRRILDRGLPLAAAEVPAGVYARPAPGDAPPAPRRAIVTDLDRTPVADVDEYYFQLRRLPVARYIHPTMLIETSRGCWWGARSHCTFCGLNGSGMGYRSKSPERVLDELRVLSERYGTHFAAVDNILDMTYFRTVLPRLAASGKPYDLFFEIKANLSREQMKLLADAGVSVVQPGLESLHDAPLEKMGKGCSVATNIQFLKWAREFGIAVTWFILSGLPVDEDGWYEEMAELAPLLHHLPPPLSLNKLEWHRFSPYHDRAGDYGLKLRPARTYAHIYPLPESTLAELAYVFEAVGASPPRQEPGKQRLKRAIREWQRGWAEAPAQLRMDETREGLRLTDTRDCAGRPSRLLTGLAADVYRACDSGRGRQGLLRHLRGLARPDLDWDEVEPELERLIADKLMVEVSGRYLALATHEPAGHHARAAFGHIDVFAYLADRRANRLSSSQMPGEVLLTQLFSNHEGISHDRPSIDP